MTSDDFVGFLEEQGYQDAGLCMFAPIALARTANRLLRVAYDNAGSDNLSVPMCSIEKEDDVLYLAANYSSAPLLHVKNSIDVFEALPGAVVLIAESGVGAEKARTLGLTENGHTDIFGDRRYSFYSFSEEYLSVSRSANEVQLPSMERVRQEIGQEIKPHFGTHEEIDARRELKTEIENLELLIARAIEPEKHGGIGHNQPPVEMLLQENIVESITININIIKNEIQLESPGVEIVEKSASILELAGEEIVDFLLRILERVKSIGSNAIAVSIVAALGVVVWKVINWLSAVLGFLIF